MNKLLGFLWAAMAVIALGLSLFVEDGLGPYWFTGLASFILCNQFLGADK